MTEWETLHDNSQRLKVFEGWILRSWITSHYAKSIHQVFIKDEFHKWEV